MMKRLKLEKAGTLFVLVIFLITAVFSVPGLIIEAQAASSDFVLTHSNSNELEQGERFDLRLKIKNISGANMSNIEFDFSKAGIINLTNGGTVYVVEPATTTVAPGVTWDVDSIPMVFVGDGSTGLMTVTVRYSLDGGANIKEVDANLVLNVERPSEPSGPEDRSQYKPNIVASVPDTLTLIAGRANNVSVTLKNTSTSYSAKEIMFDPVYESGSPFVSVKPVTEMPVKQLNYNSSAQLTLSVDVDKFAGEGVHPLTFDLSYKNSWNYEYTTKCTVYIKVANYQTNCNLVLLPPEGIAASSGGTFNLPLTLKNDGNLSAKDIRISISNLSQDSFTLVSGTGRYDLSRLFGNETRNISFNLRTASSLKSGSYPLTFKLEYTDERGTEIKDEQTVWIPVTGSGSSGTVLEVLEITPSMTTVKSSDIFDVSVKVKNSGAYDSGQVKISADGSSALMPVSQNLHIVQSIKKGETKVINFKFQPRPDASRGGVPIIIRVEPVDGEGGETISQAISVFVDTTGESDPTKNVPKLIINSYSSEPTLVKAGENFNLTMQFLNTHSTREVRNIKGSFSVTESSSETGNVFTPVGSSNTFYIDRISPRNTAEWNVTLYTIPDAKSKTYTMSISFEYEDDLGTSHTSTEIIGIPVYQPSRFEVSEISLPPETFMGQPVYTGFEMYNLGKTDIYNVKLRVEGDFEAQPKSNYFGNFESGRVEYFELNLIPMMPGQANGRIIFEYENASGEVQQVVKEFSMNVMEMEFPVDGFPVDGPGGKPGIPGMEEEPSKSFFKSAWFYIILGVVLVGVVVAIILAARKRKKDKENDF